MSSKEELIKQKKEYEKQYKKSRNIEERAELTDRIKLVNQQIKKLDEKVLVKDYVPTKDVASVADKKDRSVVRGMISGNEGIRVDI